MSHLPPVLSIALTLALAACQSTDDSATAENEAARNIPTLETAIPGQEPAVSATEDDAVCNAAPVQALVGQPISDTLIDQALKDSGSSIPRVLGVNAAATLDLQAARLNIMIDDDNVIQALHCG